MNCRKYLFFLSGFFILDLWVSDFSVIYLIIISLCNNFSKDGYLPFIILLFPIYRLLFFYIKIILQFFLCGVVLVDNIPDDDTVFQ